MMTTMTQATTPIPWAEADAELMLDPAYRDAHNRHVLADTLATALVRYRAERDLSQTALGRLLGMAQPQVCRLEAGEHAPDFATLQRICDALDLEIAIEIGPCRDGNRPVPGRLQGHVITDASTQAVIAIRPAGPARA